MEENNKNIESIDQIKAIMERSTTFISLSGKSGIVAGIIGLIAIYMVYLELGSHIITLDTNMNIMMGKYDINKIVYILLGSLILSLSLLFVFSYLNASKNKVSIFNSSSKRFAFSLFFPLGTGGIFIVALCRSGSYFFVLPVMVLFYGLALINASKYSRKEVLHYGVVAVIIGLFAAFNMRIGLVAWGMVFGVLNIFYGIKMYMRYERNNSSNK